MMKAEVLFEEVQSFSKRPVQLFCKISIGLLIVALSIVLLIDKGAPGLLDTIFFRALIVCIITAFFTMYMRNYDAAREYSGWGIKLGPMGRGYIHSGNTGLQLILNDNTKVLIGTHRTDEMEAVLHALKLL
ncbi:hypothetical protein [Parafilimonas sp.]|uniref:hypothetical protein n=1 Tax=Parafilimonas sp. TaxID=1969739 RepID=UPI0039E3151D